MQQDDTTRTPETAVAESLTVDLNVVQDNIQRLTEQSGKIKGINKSRIDTDIIEDDITTLLASAHLTMSREASVELLKFIKFKVQSGQFSKHYHRVYRSLLGDGSLTNLINGKLSDEERFDIMAKCVHRLIQKRPLVFYGAEDTAVFRDGKNNTDNNDFINVATSPAQLVDYISYSEMEFSRRITLSAFTHLYKFTGTGYNKISAHPVFIHAHSGIRLERTETPEYKKLFVSESKNPDIFKSIKIPGLLGGLKKPTPGTVCTSNIPQQEYLLIQDKPRLFIQLTLYKAMLRESIENYFADCNRAAIQSKKEACVRLMPIDLTDSNYIIANLAGNEKSVVAILAGVHRGILKSIVDQPDFTKKYPHISTIELRQTFWQNTLTTCDNPIVTYKKFAIEDMTAELTDPIGSITEKGSTADTLLCINMVNSANAYAGNRIYKNSLSSLEAEFGNRSNITTLLNPLLNPALSSTALQNTLYIRFPSGKLSSLTDIKQTLRLAAQKLATEASAAAEQTAETMPPATNTVDIKPAKTAFKFKLPGNLFTKFKPFFTKLISFFKLLANILRHMKTALIEIINSRRKR